MKLLDDYFALQRQIYDHFGHVEDWRVIPFDDAREYFWRLDGEGPGEVHFAKTEQELADKTGDYYEHTIYTQRHLPKWVYRAADYTMVCVDTHTDGNKGDCLRDRSSRARGMCQSMRRHRRDLRGIRHGIHFRRRKAVRRGHQGAF